MISPLRTTCLRHDSNFCASGQGGGELRGSQETVILWKFGLLYFGQSLRRHLTSLTFRVYIIGSLPPVAMGFISFFRSFILNRKEICIQLRFSASRYSAASGQVVSFVHTAHRDKVLIILQGSPLAFDKRQLIPFPADFPFQSLSGDQAGALSAIHSNNLAGEVVTLLYLMQKILIIVGCRLLF